MMTLENWIEIELDEFEKSHDYAVSTETIRCWITEYHEKFVGNNNPRVDEILVAFQKYRERIRQLKTITDTQYKFISMGIFGCCQLVREIADKK